MRRRLKQLAPLCAVPLVGLSLAMVLEVLWAFAGRYRYPMDIEWMEGGQLYHAYRVLRGWSIYGDCSDGWIPFPYPPMHALTVAAFGGVFGLDYAVARLVGIGAFVACGFMLCREVLLTGRSRLAGAIAAAATAGFVAASYNYTGHWYDLVRVDSVFIAWLVTGAVLSQPPPESGRGRRISTARAAAAGVALAAAVFSKQTAMFFVPWICLFALWRHRKSGAVLTLTTGGLCLVALALWQWATGGRFWGYVFVVMSRHPLVPMQARGNVLHTLVFAPYLPLVPLAALALWWRRGLERRTVFWLGMLLCAATASLLTSAKVGAFLNNLITVALLSGPVTGILAREAVLPRAEGSRPRYALALLGLCASSWLMLVYVKNGLTEAPLGAGAPVPTSEQWRQAHHLNRLVRSAQGGIIMPGHTFVPVRNGHQNRQIHEQGYIDLMGSGAAVVDVNACLDRLGARWLIADDATNPYLHQALLTMFDFKSRLPSFAYTTVGAYTRPVAIYRRKPSVPARAPRHRVRPLFDFEDTSYQGWQRQGDAFAGGPTRSLNGYQQVIAGHRGRYLVSSYQRDTGDGATGRMISPPFVIDRGHLGFRAGGGTPGLRVELVVEGKPVRVLDKLDKELELLVPFTWDVRELRGKEARLVLVDASRAGWGHILADAFELYDAAGD